MKLNSRSCNLRHLQDALGALSAAASAARLAASTPVPPGMTPPCRVEADRFVLGAAKRAAEAGATAREISGVTLLPLSWCHGAAKYGAPGGRSVRVAR